MRAFLRILLLPLLILSSMTASSQAIRGEVKDEAGKPFPMANVLLLKAEDSTLVKGMVANDAGLYSMDKVPSGKYLLAATVVGYRKAYSAPFTISSTTAGHQLSPLTVLPDARQLHEVTVTAQKPLFEQQIDRMVINVQSSITAAGSTALDVLERSPGIMVDRQNNALLMNGKQGVMVMLNGKLSRLPMEAVMQMLGGMNAGNIEKIEIITTPPSGYDAEGNAGLINIVFKKNTNYGSNGTYTINIGYGRFERVGGSMNVNHRSEKINLFADYSGQMDHFLMFMNTDRSIREPVPIVTTLSGKRDFRNWMHNGRAGFDYTVGLKTTLSALATAFSFRQDQLAFNHSQITRNARPDTRMAIRDRELNHSWNYTGNLNIRHKLSSRQELNADLDYIYFFNNNPHSYQFSYDYIQENRQEVELLNNTKRTPGRLWVAKADYSLEASRKLKLESGVKSTFSRFENDIDAQRQTNEVWAEDPSLTMHVLMDETIHAAYANVSQQLTAKSKLQAGVRYEHTVTDLRTFSQQPLVYRNYGNWFPTLFFSQDLSKKSSLQFAFSRRITRPTFRDLAPFFTIFDPTSTIGGNDRLLPALSSNLQTTYRFRSNYLLTFEYTNTRNAIFWNIKILPEENRQITQRDNIARVHNYSVSLGFPLQIATWWQMQLNLQAVRQQGRTKLAEEDINRSIQYGRINLTQTFRLPQYFTVEVNGFYQSRSLNGILVRRPFGSLNIGVQKKLKEQAGTLRLSAEDVLWTQRMEFFSQDTSQGYSTNFNFMMTSRVVRLTYSRNFGNQNVKVNSKRSTGAEEERQRVN
ncbi:outer membrane beta-barrel protein [Telluribacter sp. SYSU D00476]|uniref:outer membrane beta-barrel protein n=1 Tax=Telluribacter sp. SYSU D00476 TaxID=2811430 RepID=UPI001FF11E23|nr:outer membrane beta-barrel protein [Telluribacter sp. SYSU D00476]